MRPVCTLAAPWLHPGGVWTNFVQYIPQDTFEQLRVNPEIGPLMKSAEQDAATFVLSRPRLQRSGRAKGGKYLVGCRVIPPATNITNAMDDDVGSRAYDQQGEDRLGKF